MGVSTQFKIGNKLATGGARQGSGRKASKQLQRKRFLDKYPSAYEELLEAEYLKGVKGNSNSAQYVMDRIKGRPHQSIDQRIKGEVEINADRLRLAIEKAAEYQRIELGRVVIPQLGAGNATE